MFSQEQLEKVIKLINDRDIESIRSSYKDLCVLYPHQFNNRGRTKIRLTEDHRKYKSVHKEGNVILDTEEVISVLDKFEELSDTIESIDYE